MNKGDSTEYYFLIYTIAIFINTATVSINTITISINNYSDRLQSDK